MSQSSITARELRHQISKMLFIAHLHIVGRTGLSQDQQLETVDAAIKLTTDALAGLGNLRDLIQSRKAAFEQIVTEVVITETPSDIDIKFDEIVKGENTES